MSGIRKSTDAGLTNAERKSLRESEAKEAMSDHDDAEKAFHANRERLRTARLAREAVAGPVLYPALGLPDKLLSLTFGFQQGLRTRSVRPE